MSAQLSVDFSEKQRDALASDFASDASSTLRVDAGTRALYATDASNYRHVPIGVVQPRSIEEVLHAVRICREHDVAITSRGAATSTSGQACNEAVIIDFARFFKGVTAVDVHNKTAKVLPGTVLDDLNAHVAQHSLRFGPDPSTHSRCTIAGMIGNNSCGAHSITWGKTADNVISLDIVLYDGTELTVGPTTEQQLEALCQRTDRVGDLYRQLKALRDAYASDIRDSFPTLPRRVSGFNLDQLLPENGFNVARTLVGTEGSCAIVVSAEITLVEAPKATCLTVIGFTDIFAAADCVPALLQLEATAIEGMDSNLLNAYVLHHRGLAVRELLPEGNAWLLVETVGDTTNDAKSVAIGIVESLRSVSVAAEVVTDANMARSIWRIREDGAGIATRRVDGSEAWPGWEDPAVPPENLGPYLRAFEALLVKEDLHAVTYGHFGDGCVHSRIDFDFQTPDGRACFRRFIENAADLVIHFGGSLSGEHGDGQARGELVAKMYPPRIMEAFAAFKAAFDPNDRMNPGGIVRPRRIDADLRIHVAPATMHERSNLALTADNGDLAAATRRCVGVGRCLNAKGGVMCPSYRATNEERHSPRGRSHLLFEMLSGDVVQDGWKSKEVLEALDLCLGCKGCKSDCPVNVDIATYKVEFLARHYARRLRPIAHYSMGYLPTWLRYGAKAPRLVNAINGSKLAGPIKKLGGIARERAIPMLAKKTFQSEFAKNQRSAKPAGAKRVMLWPDTFTNFFEPQIGRDAVAVLSEMGYEVEVPMGSVCCGLTWLSTGQIDKARSTLQRSLAALQSAIENDTPIIGLEPSCTALLRAEATELLPGDASAAALSRSIRTFAEFLNESDIALTPVKSPGAALAQVHCHQHAELGFTPDQNVLAAIGVDLKVLDEGCCGLAGNFGFEKDHYDVSRKCAESGLLPAVNGAASDVSILADGFSCRTQVRQLSDRDPVHLASYVAELLGLK